MSFSMSHVGKVRVDNQDAVRLCDPESELTNASGHLYAIADGMGGFSHGGVASTLALETFFNTFYSSDGMSPLQKFRTGIQNANVSVYQAAHRVGGGRMGTTLTSVAIIGAEIFVGHVGDSRAYLIREGEASCLTNDHTRVGELVRMKLLPPERLRTHSQRSVLSKCVGLELFVQPDAFSRPARVDDTIILCTDGVWSVVEDKEFGDVCRSHADVESIGRVIFDTAMERDSDDNISVVVLRIKHLGGGNPQIDKRQGRSFNTLFRRNRT